MRKVSEDPEEYPNRVPQDVEVSVYMLTYQHSDFIEQAINGVLMQKTNFKFELCIGEDDSNDGTREICKAYADKYPHLIRLFLRSERDKLFIDGRKTGKINGIKTKKACRGRYIASCEGDDFWIDPYKLQKQFDYLERNPHLKIVAARALFMNPSIQSKVFPPYFVGDFITYDEISSLLYIPHTSTYFYRSIKPSEYPSWHKEVIQGDLFLIMHLCRNQGGLPLIKDLVSVYRVHTGGIMSGSKILDRLQINNKFWQKCLKVSQINGDKEFEKIACRNIYRKTFIYRTRNLPKALRFFCALINPKLGWRFAKPMLVNYVIKKIS